jgi:hypothetical protein
MDVHKLIMKKYHRNKNNVLPLSIYVNRQFFFINNQNYLYNLFSNILLAELL